MQTPDRRNGGARMEKKDVYLYGMILMTTSHLLRDDYPEADQYSEIKQSFRFPGGETGCCANVLSSLRLTVRMDGNYQGRNTYQPLVDFFEKTRVDMSRLVNSPEFDGVEDLVIIDTNTRTCFGRFVEYFSRPKKLWSMPQREDIEAADTVGLDPFFGEASEEVAKIAHELNKPYVTIDCKYDSLLHNLSSVNVISNEFIRGNYAGEDIDELFERYTANSDGLVIFTFGSKKIIYGRKGGPIQIFIPFSVQVVSTLGAGDTFKAGAIYALHQKMNDLDLVRFAAATAGIACESYPIAYNPPTLEKIEELLTRA